MDAYRAKLKEIRKNLKLIVLRKHLLSYALRRREKRGYFRADILQIVQRDPAKVEKVARI